MEPKMNRNFVLGILIPAVMVTLFFVSAESSPQEYVRVAVLKDVEDFSLSTRGRYKIIDLATDRELNSGKRMRAAQVVLSGAGMVIGEEGYPVERLRITGSKDVSVSFKGKTKKYRGQIDIIRTKDNALTVVNRVDLESYVKGVLYHEVPRRWPLQAIQAQAIVTRTYALYQTKERARQLYDVTGDIYSQVYGGRSAERHRTNIAVNRTRGAILTYQNKILPAYFHSMCAGHTENAAELWQHDLKPLSGIKCDFCSKAPHSNWKKNFRSKDIQGKLNKNGYSLGFIQDIRVLERTPSGRAKTLKITTRDGMTDTITAVKFRELVGPNVLKSNDYDIKMAGYYFDVIGHGWGHGVGMCQWGAYEMSRQRYKYDRILEYYYPGAQITNISK
jgi:stage II sporulation protein D